VEPLDVGEPHDPDSACGEVSGAPRVAGGLVAAPVLPAIELDGQPVLRAEEVDDVRSDGVLAPELRAETSIAQQEPETALGFRVAAP
jgi:hypothetical protein